MYNYIKNRLLKIFTGHSITEKEAHMHHECCCCVSLPFRPRPLALRYAKCVKRYLYASKKTHYDW